MPEIHTTEYKTFKRCKRKWAMSVLAGLRPQKINTAFMLGTGVHAFLETLYANGGADSDEAQALAIQAYYDAVGEDVAQLHAEGVDETIWLMQEDDILANIELGSGMIERYIPFAQEHDNFTVVKANGNALVEVRFEMPIFNPKTKRKTNIKFAGTIDGIIRDDNGYWLMEHKTAAQIKTGHLRQEEQATNYMAWSVKKWPKLEGQLRGVLYNYLRKKEPSPTVKAPLFHRERVYRNQCEVEFAVETLYYVVEDMKRVANDPDHLAYPSPTMDCTWDCPYRDLCLAMNDGTNVEILLHVGYRVDDGERTWEHDWMPHNR